MASLRRVPRSPNYIACFTGDDGKRYQRSTGIKVTGKVEARRQAQRVADEFEDLSRRKRSAQQVQRVFKDLYQEITATDLPNSSVKDFGDRWLTGKKAEVSDSTFAFYQGAYNKFIRHLGDRANAALFEISREEIQSWRDQEAERVSPSTVNHGLKFVRMLFAAARRDGLIADNPAEDVAVLKRDTKSTRRPFTIAEVKALLEAADTEWKSMILFGLYTGQRLGDIARLTWDQLDLDAKEIRLQTGKTGRFQKIPISPTLLKHIESLPEPAHGQIPLHEKAEEIVNTQGKTGSLSNQFHKIMSDAGIVPKKTHRKTEEAPGRKGRRPESRVSFHSLRHTTTSLMKNAGVSPAIAEEFVGHDSAEMNRVYTHIELKSMKRAAKSLPDVNVT
ncbi:MAG: tyrosine-type recombinase/integrase [Verrucomicrobiales bacterium]